MSTYTTYTQAMEALEAAFNDAEADGLDPDECAYDIVNSVAGNCTPKVAADLRRCNL